MNEDRELRRYRSLPFKREVKPVRDESGAYFVCRYPELPGLSADGVTRAEAVKNAEEAFDDYIRIRSRRGDLPPLPAGARRVLRALSMETLELDLGDPSSRGTPVIAPEEGASESQIKSGVEVASTSEENTLTYQREIEPAGVG